MAEFFRAFSAGGFSDSSPAEYVILPKHDASQSGFKLAVNASGTGLEWVDAAGGNPYTYDLPQPSSTGQLLVSTGTGNILTDSNTKWLGRGAAGMYLRMDASGNNLEWANAPTASSGGSTGTITPGSDSDSRLPNSPGANRVLVTSGAGNPHSSSESVNVAGGNTSYWSSQGFSGDSLSINQFGNVAWVKKQDGLSNIFASNKSQILIANGTGNAENVSGNEYWLEAGNAGQLLSSNGTGFVWVDASTGSSGNTAASAGNLPTANDGQLVLISTSQGDPLTDNNTTWLSKGLNGQSLSMANGSIVWRDKQDRLPTTSGTNKSELFISVDSGTPSDPASTGIWFPSGNSGQILATNAAGSFSWINMPTAGGGTTPDPTALPTSPEGQRLLLSTNSGDPLRSNATTWMSRGQNGQSVSFENNAVVWRDKQDKLPDTIGSNKFQLPVAFDSGTSGDFASSLVWLEAGSTGQVLTTLSNGSVAWRTPSTSTSSAPADPTDLPDTGGNLRILWSTGSGDPLRDSVTKWTGRGFSGQSLTIQSDNTVGWEYKEKRLPSKYNNAGKYLKVVDNSTIEWADIASSQSVDLPNAPASQRLLVSTSSGDPLTTNNTSWTSAGLNGQSLSMHNGAIAWRNKQDSLANINNSTKMQLHVVVGSGISENPAGNDLWLDAGSSGQFLSSNGSSLQWVNAPTSGGSSSDLPTDIKALSNTPTTSSFKYQPKYIPGVTSSTGSGYKYQRSKRTYARYITNYKLGSTLNGATTSTLNHNITLTHDQRHELKAFGATKSYLAGYDPQNSSIVLTIDANNGKVTSKLDADYMVHVSVTVSVSVDKDYVEGRGFSYQMANAVDSIPSTVSSKGFGTYPTVAFALSLLVNKAVGSAEEYKGEQIVLFVNNPVLWYEEIDLMLKGTFYVRLSENDTINARLYWGSIRSFTGGRMKISASRATTDHVFVREIPVETELYL